MAAVLIRFQNPETFSSFIFSLYTPAISFVSFGRDFMTSPMVVKNSPTGNPKRSSGRNILPMAATSDSIDVVPITIFAPMIMRNTLRVLTAAIVKPSSVIISIPE